MPSSILVMVTVLFSVICGNHLRDNRFLATSFMETNSLKSFNNEEMQKNLNGKNSANYRCIDIYGNNCKDTLLTVLKDPHQSSTCEQNVLYNTEGKCKSYNGRLNDVFIESNYHNMQEKPSVSSSSSSSSSSAMPVTSHYKEFYNHLILENKKPQFKRTESTQHNNRVVMNMRGKCDCKIKNDLMDLGPLHYPRFLLNSVCQAEIVGDNLDAKCAHGLVCRPLEYKVKVLIYHTVNDDTQKATTTLSWLPQELRQIWKFKTVTVTAGCFCA